MLTDEQENWLRAQATHAAQVPLSDEDYDILAWADAAVDAWEHQAYAQGKLPAWYHRHYDDAVQFMLDELYRRGARLAEEAARARLAAEPQLRHLAFLLLDAQRELLWLEHLRFLNTADPNLIADSTDLYRPRYESVFATMEAAL